MPDYGAASSAGSIIAGMVGTYSANQVAGIQAGTADYIRASNNKLVAAENKRDAVLTQIARWRQSVYNSRVMENAAADQEMLTTNFARMKDARSRASFSDQINFAEQEGRMQAQAAASGVTGSVVDILNATLRMKKGIEDTNRAQTDRQLDYDEQRKEGSVWAANMDKLDQSLIFDNPRSMDFGQTVVPTRSLLSGIDAKDVKNVAQGASSFNFSFNTPAPTDWSGVDYLATRDN
jgi:2-hydroxychromene-2-carboxylate isomerase